MYNVSKPTLDDLPSSKQLLRSTFIALVAAIAILVAIVLPSEHAIDPTGIGRVPMSSTLEIIHKYHIISAQISAWEKP
ncbi:hypothetical protein VZ232_18140, partial [Pseudomonas aeruginosa]|nr:hypothetical protein [Pseudomonas aeruginosa]